MENRIRRYAACGAWLACLLAMGMAACGRQDPGADLEAAADSFAAGNHEDAALRLNYVVQLEPGNVRARELRGDIALLLGDYASAASEFERASELGARVESVALRLAEAYVAQGQYDEALALLDSTDAGLAGDPLYWTLRAEALLAADRLPEAERSLDEGQQVGDGGAHALTVRAQVAFARNEPAKAFELLDQALNVAPNDPRVHIAHAELLSRTDQLAEAAAELQHAADLYHAVSLGPRETLTLLGLVQIHLARNDLDAAEAVAARLALQAPQALLTSYFQGLVEFRRGRFDEAAALIQPLVNLSPETIQFRSLLGAIQLARGNLGQAEQQFLRVLATSPRDPAAVKLLAETRLRQQRPGAALDALRAVQDTAAEDSQIGLLSGIATMQSGNTEQGLLYLEQAAALDPTNELLKLQLARAYLATGRDAEALNLLTGSFGDDAQALEASLLRLFAEGRRGDAESATAIAENLLTAHPDDPRAITAVAVYYQLNGDTERARGLFERAAGLETEGATARLFIAASLVQEGRQEEAEQLLRRTIQEQPENAQAIAGHAQLLASRGALEEAATLFSRAAGHTASVSPRLALVQLRLRQGNLPEAKRELDNAAATAPENPEVIALRGIVALAEGRAGEAVVLLERAASLLPDRLGIALALARARLVNGQTAAARETLLSVLEIAPRSLPVRLALGDVELQSGNAEAALSIAADLKADFPAQAGGYLLEGEALMAARRYAAAVDSLAAAFERLPSWAVLAARIQALRLAGRPAEALDANEAWVADNPEHVGGALMRAMLLEAAGRERESLQAYEAVLDIEPESLVALNNAAWVSHELGDPAALSFAERAYEVGPDNADVLDTFGWILLAQGNDEPAIEHLARAAELSPQSSEIRYHLAEALAAAGQSTRAREVLTVLLAEEREFEQRPDAERLLESM